MIARLAAIAVLILFTAVLVTGEPAAPSGRERAFFAARQVLDEMILDGRSGWTSMSRLTAAYPVYVEGIDGISYYEVKVKNGEYDAGYILVCVNGVDIEVPEHTALGPTLNELYRGRTRRDDVKVYRYDWIRSSAKIRNPRTGRLEIMAALGFQAQPRVVILDYHANWSWLTASLSTTPGMAPLRGRRGASRCT